MEHARAVEMDADELARLVLLNVEMAFEDDLWASDIGQRDEKDATHYVMLEQELLDRSRAIVFDENHPGEDEEEQYVDRDRMEELLQVGFLGRTEKSFRTWSNRDEKDLGSKRFVLPSKCELRLAGGARRHGAVSVYSHRSRRASSLDMWGCVCGCWWRAGTPRRGREC